MSPNTEQRYRQALLRAGLLLGLFGDPLLASTAVDRLLHYSHVLVLEGESYRNPQRARSKAAKGAAAPENNITLCYASVGR